MKALILAAGYATRLYPLTREYPKPLLTVGRRPIIDFILEKLVQTETIDEIIVVTNSKFFSLFQKWQQGLNVNKQISLVDDLTKDHGDRRGAIGDMHFVIENKGIQDDLLVIGGDNLFEGGLSDFLSFAKANSAHPVIGAYDIEDISEARKYGVIKLDDKKQIVDFQEKPKEPESTLIAMCLYYFPNGSLGLIGEYLQTKANKHDATGFYIDWLRKKEAVYGFVFKGHWYDIGDHKFYNQAKERFSS